MVYGAIGLWTGTTGNGVVILDVDANLKTLRGWGEDFNGPCVYSLDQAECRQIHLPLAEALWRNAGFGLSDVRTSTLTRCCGDVSGVIYGEYGVVAAA